MSYVTKLQNEVTKLEKTVEEMELQSKKDRHKVTRLKHQLEKAEKIIADCWERDELCDVHMIIGEYLKVPGED